MSLLAQLTVTALWFPLAITPPGMTAFARLQAPEAAPPVAVQPAPVVVAPVAVAPVAVAPVAVAPVAVAPVAVAPVAVAPAAAPTVVAPAGSTVVVTDGAPARIVTPWPADVATTTSTTTTTTTATTVMTTAAPAPAPAPVLSPKAAVRNLLRYDPYLAPRYRSGRNMMIGGGVMLGVGAVTLLGTLSWFRTSKFAIDNATSASERHQLIDHHNQWVPTARVVGVVAGAVLLTGVLLLATGGVRKRRAIEEARGRVFMQAGPGGMQVRF